MTDAGNSTQRLLALRKSTRAIADLLRGQLKEYVSALTPLLNPSRVLGDCVAGTRTELPGSAKAFEELQSIFRLTAGSKPFNLSRELKGPIEIASSTLELTPVEYLYEARTNGDTKTVVVTSPLRWMLSYSGFSPRRLKEFLADPHLIDEESARFVLHYAVLGLVVSKQTSVTHVFDALRFPLSVGRSSEFGELPITYISSPVPTLRPPDQVIIESTEISGRDVFEEIVDVDALANIRDAFKERLVELVKSYGAV